jgi:hypothetical protein
MKTERTIRGAAAAGTIVAAALFAAGAAPVERCWSQDRPPAKPPSDLETLVQGNNEFAFDLYRRLAETDGNVIFSPYSISNALAMTYAGARGQTAEQMASVLHFRFGQERLHATFGELIAQIQQEDNDRSYQLHLANSLWGQCNEYFGPRNLVTGDSAMLKMTSFWLCAISLMTFEMACDSDVRPKGFIVNGIIRETVPGAKGAKIIVDIDKMGKIAFHVLSDTKVVFSDKKPATVSDLKKGQHVRVRYNGSFDDSDPPQTNAVEVVIERKGMDK